MRLYGSAIQQQISNASSLSPHKPKPMASVAKVAEPTLPRLRSRVVSSGKALATENMGSSSEDDADDDAQFRFSLNPNSKHKTEPNNDPDFVQSRFLSDRPKKKNLFSPDSLVLQAADRGQFSSRKLTSVAAALLVESGEDLNEHVVSHRTCLLYTSPSPRD